MAGKPLDGFADRVQYPLASPSKAVCEISVVR